MPSRATVLTLSLGAIPAHLATHTPLAIFFLPGAWSSLSPYQLSLSQTPPTLCSHGRASGAHVASARALGSALCKHSPEAARTRQGLPRRGSSKGLKPSLGPTVVICQNVVAAALRIVYLGQNFIFQQHRTLQQRTPALPKSEASVTAPVLERSGIRGDLWAGTTLLLLLPLIILIIEVLLYFLFPRIFSPILTHLILTMSF